LNKLLEVAETGGSPRSDFTGPNPDPQGTLLAIQWDERLLPAYKVKYDILIGLLGGNQLRSSSSIAASAMSATARRSPTVASWR